MSVLFDSIEIQNATYIPRFIQHEDSPDRIVTSLPRAREDGEVLIAEMYGTKVVRIQGTLIGASSDDLESKIDAFKELFSRPEKNLDITWNAGTRRYVATCTRHTFNRDHFNVSAVPWVAEFTVLTGAGKDTSTTTPLSAHSVNTTTPVADSFTMLGSKPANPYITIKGSNFSGVTSGVEYKNTDTGERIVFNKQSAVLGNTDYVYFDCASKKVFYSTDGITLTESTFYGTFPNFKIGTNNVQITCGDITSQASAETALTNVTSAPISATTTRLAQSFTVPYTDATFRSITVALSKTGTTMGAIDWQIETDNNGSPSGTIADANATGTIAYASITGSIAYIKSVSTGQFTLQANVRYWLVLRASATLDGSNFYSWETQPSIYPNGKRKTSTNSGVAYSAGTAGTQFVFKILYGGYSASSSVLHTVTYTKAYL